jgi:hypothetical protein
MIFVKLGRFYSVAQIAQLVAAYLIKQIEPPLEEQQRVGC